MAKRLQLFYPFMPFIIHQKFGENLACSNEGNKKIVAKVNGVCPVGFTDFYPKLGLKGHNGLDLYAPDGVLLRSPINGTVIEVSTDQERGMGVGVATDEDVITDHGTHRVKVRQWHMKQVFVKKGQKVRIGDILGAADSTGYSAGSHNHFEIKPLYTGSNDINAFQNNGYYGAIDPLPYFTGYSASQYQTLMSRLSFILQRIKEMAALVAKSGK